MSLPKRFRDKNVVKNDLQGLPFSAIFLCSACKSSLQLPFVCPAGSICSTNGLVYSHCIWFAALPPPCFGFPLKTACTFSAYHLGCMFFRATIFYPILDPFYPNFPPIHCEFNNLFYRMNIWAAFVKICPSASV